MTFSIFAFLSDAAAAAPQPPGSFQMIVPFIGMGVVFYFLLIRPQQKRQKELASLISSVKTGDKVVTTGGIHGLVSNVKDGPTLILKIADNVKIEVDKSAITIVDRSSNASATATPAISNS
jgi:preprotein translocase subunit YajC